MKKVVVSALSTVIGAAVGAVVTGKEAQKTVDKTQKMSDKHLALFLMMNQWVKVKQEGKNISEYFEKHGYKKIAIYGMSYAGENLIDELKGTGIEVAYAIDRNADTLYADVDIVSVEGELAPVDAVVVTAITFFDEIEEKLAEKVNCPILSLEDVLYEV